MILEPKNIVESIYSIICKNLERKDFRRLLPHYATMPGHTKTLHGPNNSMPTNSTTTLTNNVTMILALSLNLIDMITTF